MKTLAISMIALTGALGACSTTPEKNASLEAARTAVMQIHSDPQVVANAPLALDRAMTTLSAAEQAWRDSPGDARVDHLAYLARQRAATARELAGLKSAEQAVQQASANRDQLLLEARTREAELARLEAHGARQMAQQHREMATTSRQRAAQLRQQLKDMQVSEAAGGGVRVMLSGVLFETGEAQLKPGARRRLEQLASVLRDDPAQTAIVEGFTDNVGDESLNKELSERRAQAVRDALAALGVEPSRIQTRP
jgi:outer membrane protein OmpA-like peptidoglycan-associated protein